MSNQEFLSPDLPADAPGVRLQLLQYAEIKLAEALAFRAGRLASNGFEASVDMRAVATLTLSLVRLAKLLGGPDDRRTGPRPARPPADDDIDDDLLLDDSLDPLSNYALDRADVRRGVREGAARRPSQPGPDGARGAGGAAMKDGVRPADAIGRTHEPAPLSDGDPSADGAAPAPETQKMGAPAGRPGASRPPPPQQEGFLDPRYSAAARAAMTAKAPPGG